MKFKEWLYAETEAVFDGTKPKDGCGWNWEGSPGDKTGIEIGGEVNTVKEDPDGTGRKYKKSRKKGHHPRG